MKSVGEKLRLERIERGIDIATLSSLTRISTRYIEAIESGNAKDLPSGFFYRSFVRQYASALGLDSEGMEAELERVRLAEEPALVAALDDAFPVKTPNAIVMEGNRRYLGTGRTSVYVALLIAVLVGCSWFYGWWRHLETNPATRAVEAAQAERISSTPAPNFTTASAAEPILPTRAAAVATPEPSAPEEFAPAPDPVPVKAPPAKARARSPRKLRAARGNRVSRHAPTTLLRPVHRVHPSA